MNTEVITLSTEIRFLELKIANIEQANKQLIKEQGTTFKNLDNIMANVKMLADIELKIDNLKLQLAFQ